MLQQSYPIQCILKDGSKISVRTERELWYLMLTQNRLLAGGQYEVEIDFNKEEGNIISKEDATRVTLFNCVNNGDLWGIFVKGHYSNLPVLDRTVIDIGANVADSSIYFALRGAKRVIAFEPFLENYNIGIRNIRHNNLIDRICLVLSGISSESGSVKLNSQNSNTLSFIHLDTDTDTEGLDVPLVTIAEIMDRYSVEPGSILKVDCEGCEHEAILSLNDNYLKKFSNIIIEYHYGYKDLRKKLEDSGFKVLYERPTHWKQEKKSRSLYTGLITASKKLV